MLTDHLQLLAVKLELTLVGGIGCLNGHAAQLCTTIDALDPGLFKSNQIVHYVLLLLRNTSLLQSCVRRTDRNVHLLAPLF